MTQFMKLLLGCVLLLLQACSGLLEDEDSPYGGQKNIFSDPQLRQLYTYQDQRATDSLLPYLFHEEALYREKAAEGFGSVQDSAALPQLIQALQDSSQPVVRASAYALGQIRNERALPELQRLATLSSTPTETLPYLLEAIGKCANDEALEFLNSYPLERSPEGVALGLYRGLLRKRQSESSLAIAASLTKKEFSEKARFFASAYLARQSLDLTPFTERLIHSLRNDGSAFVRMNAATALKNTTDGQTAKTLMQAVKRDESHLVRINALKSLAELEVEESKVLAYQAINETPPQVAITAAQLLAALAGPRDKEGLENAVATAKQWRVKSILLKALVSINIRYTNTVLEQLKEQGDPYARAALLGALAGDPQNYSYFKERLEGMGHPAIKTKAIESLVEIRNSPGFEQYVKQRPQLKSEYAEIWKQAILSADIALVYHASIELRNAKHNYAQYYKDFDFITHTLERLKKPESIEAYQELKKTLSFFQGEQNMPEIEKNIAHPINWKEVVSIPERQQVKITTAKGYILLELLVNKAPGTVSTIVGLIKEGFYNGKTFHRVVPNFVAQGGCPRGDGFGGLSYTIRSEFAPLYYEQGSVGVASAGKDTESCQWFITHSPTPHLDGRYTIFANVIRGMDVVQQLEVGDIIEHIALVP